MNPATSIIRSTDRGQIGFHICAGRTHGCLRHFHHYSFLCMKTVWIDIDNSPHVPLFAPIISDLQNRGIRVLVTTRDFAQTIPLLEQYGLKFIRVDGHGGANKIRKVASTIFRALKLAWILRREHIDLMVNHGARSGIIAAKLLRIPVVSGFDYEHTELRILFGLSDLVLAPEALKDKFKESKTIRFYPGIKEQVYLSDSNPMECRKSPDLGFPFESKIPLVVLRPPSFVANYHSPDSDVIFLEVLRTLRDSRCTIVFLPRSAEDTKKVEDFIKGPSTKCHFIVLDKPVNGRALICKADLVISGGGTMLREAAILNTPAYSIFCSEPPLIDLELEQSGKLQFIRKTSHLSKLKIEKKKNFDHGSPVSREAREFIVQAILGFVS